MHAPHPSPDGDAGQDWSIREVVRLTGVTSRALRHYDAIGLLTPSRVAGNGYRHYDEAALVRLQRILLMRELGLGLSETARALEDEADEVVALRRHVEALRTEQGRLGRQVAAVERTIRRLEEGEPQMAHEMFEGFDHSIHQDEVTERWGAKAWADANRWWEGLGATERADFGEVVKRLSADWASAADAGVDPTGEEAQLLARRHVEWLGSIPGTPGAGGASGKAYVVGLGEMYVADPRFGANYGGERGARFVRDALAAFAERNL